MTTKSNILSSFNHANAAIQASIAKLMAITPIKPNTFRLSVITPDDTMPEGNGQYKMEAQVMLQLINTAYSELVSILNRVTRKDTLIALHDRHRHNSGWDDQYDGGENDAEPEATELSIEDQVLNAIDRAEVVMRYAKHIASVKGGGAEWLTGFTISTWVPNEGLKDTDTFTVKEVLESCSSGVNLETHILLGRVHKVDSVVENRLIGFTTWCKQQVGSARAKDKVTEWTKKLAYASTMGIDIADIPVNDACSYIGDLVSKPAFDRKTSRLEDAVRQVGNSKYLGVAYAIKQNIAALKVKENELDKTFIKASEFLPYSDMLQLDIAHVCKSEEWEDHQLALDVTNAEIDARRDMRAALREQTMFSLEKQAVQIAAIRGQASDIRAMIAAAKADLYKPVSTQADLEAEIKIAAFAKEAAEAKKAKAAATRKAKAEAKAKQPRVPSTAPTPQLPKLNPAGPRSTTH